ncbi:flagellar protein FlgN [Nocardioides aquiterrae]|uniref:Flagellar protein FlgN n=1 Tax=Nocardioides aquiterrae TaxID=203799 RepID=A0ABN1UBS5_9ACTN
MDVEKLSLVLWRERELLEALQYRLAVEQLVMAGGQTRWLANAARDVEQAVEELRSMELLRAVAADEAASAAGLAPNPSLSALIAAADEPWRSILADHREAFAAMTEEIERIAATNRALIANGLRAAHETLLGADDGGRIYTAAGATVSDGARTAVVDRSL